ncbi:hypothetical protein V6N13_072985 [Hibiscus sabdariffa]
MVPNSFPSKGTIEKMLEGNATVDWQVMGTSSWLVEENLGIEQCIEDTHAGTLDLSTECELELAGRGDSEHAIA